MQINGLGGVSAYNTNNRNSGGFELPDIGNEMTNKGQSKLGEQQIKDKLLDIAKKHVNSGGGDYRGVNDYLYQSPNLQKLKQDYVSFASPDRKTIINNTLSGLAQKLKMLMPALNFKNNLLELLMKHSRAFGSKNIGNNFIDFKDASGVTVASYCQLPGGGMGFMECPTNAEIARRNEFGEMWYDAIRQAGQEYHNTNNIIEGAANGNKIDLDVSIKFGTPLDMDKLAAHGITYNAETGETHVDMDKLKQMVNK